MTTGDWTDLWTLICHRYGRTPHPDLGARYLDQLERAGLTDEEIRAGVDRVLWDDEGIYGFPSPRKIADAASGTGRRDVTREAMDAWARVLDMASDWRGARPEVVLDESGQRALRQVGGIRKLALMDTRELDFRRKDFLEAYEAGHTSAGTRALAPMTDAGRRLIEEAMNGGDVAAGPAAGRLGP